MNVCINRLDNIVINCKSYELVSSSEMDDVKVDGAIIGVGAEYILFGENVVEIIRNPELVSYIGEIMHRALMRKPVMYFVMPTYEDEFNFTKDEFDLFYGNRALLLNNLAYAFSMACWLIKESCVCCRYAYWYNPIFGYFLSAQRNLNVTLSDGSISEVSFDEKEVCEAIDKMYDIYHLLLPEEADVGEVEITKNGETLCWEIEKAIGTEGKSFARALVLLQEARNTGRLATKIDKYCSVLECVYAITQNHKKNISQITAAYIGESDAEREIIEVDMRDAYGIRSDSSHGDNLKYLSNHSRDSLARLSSKIDNYVRRVLRKVLYDTSLNYNKDDDSRMQVQLYFLEMVKKVH